MTEPDSGAAGNESVEEMRARLAELEAENEQLKQSKPGGSMRTWRWVAAILLVVIGSLVAFSAIGAFWVNRFVMDTDTFVSTLAPLADDPQIQAAISNGVSDAIFESFDLEDQLSALLGGIQDAISPYLKERGVDLQLPADALAAPLASSIENAVRQQTAALVASDQFKTLFETTLREGHQAFLAALSRGQDASDAGLITIEGEALYLNVNAFANAVKDRLVASGFTFFERIPLTRAQGQVELLNSPALIQVLVAIRTLNTAAWFLPLFALGILTGAVFAAPDRRRGLIAVAVGLIAITFVGLLGIQVGRAGISSVAANQGLAAAAVVAAYDILPRGLVTLLRLVLSLAVLILIGAVITGPAHWAVAMRTWLGDLARGTGPGAQVAEFVAKWRAPLAGGGVLLGVLVALVFPITAIEAFWIAVVVLVWVFLVQTIGRRGDAAGQS